MTQGFLPQALIYLTAAIIFVPVAKRLGMGSVLGYLIAGMIIGPFFLGFVGTERQDVLHFAEFGVVMMLFLIGLELEPSHFWRMRNIIVGMGTIQVMATAALAAAGLILAGFDLKPAIAAGLAVSMSSTAIVLQSLKEKGLSETSAGRSSFSVLLFQDMSVIPILALLPLLAVSPAGNGAGHNGSVLEGLPGWLQTTAVLGAGALVVLGGRYVIVPLLRLIARAHLREIFTASALLIVVATAFLMNLVGLSPALGTFLAGVVLANSEFRHELESDIEPFKGLLLGLFFISVGASINFGLITGSPALIFTLVGAAVLIKALVLFAAGRIFRLSLDQNLIFTLGLSQIGEFAFVLFSFMGQLNILPRDWTEIMMAVTAMTMTVTPLLLFAGERFILPWFGTPEREAKQPDAIDARHRVIIAGFGDFGSTVGRFLRANGVDATILDNDSDRVDLLRKMGFRVFYGDATRLDILKSAGAEDADMFITTLTDHESNSALIDSIRKHFPGLSVMARVKNRQDAYELVESCVDGVYRDYLDTAVRLGVDALVKLGHRRYSAVRAGQNFIKYDEASIIILAPHCHDKTTYISNAREQIRLQEQLLTNDREANPAINDHAWETGPSKNSKQ
ncbi:MAG: cation:proton antiporter [Spirochaetes bacterium]|nr:cation:proton antiporter [Spirochaetota bacterium]